MHPNAAVLREADEAMLAGDLEAFFSHYTDDVAVHVGGNNDLAGDYEGLDRLRELFGRFMDAAGEYTFENHAYLADDEHGVIMQKSTMTRDGQSLSLNEVFVVHFRDGKISEMWYLPGNQAAFDTWVRGTSA